MTLLFPAAPRPCQSWKVAVVMGQGQGEKGRQSLSRGCRRRREAVPCVNQGSNPLQRMLDIPSDLMKSKFKKKMKNFQMATTEHHTWKGYWHREGPVNYTDHVSERLVLPHELLVC